MARKKDVAKVELQPRFAQIVAAICHKAWAGRVATATSGASARGPSLTARGEP